MPIESILLKWSAFPSECIVFVFIIIFTYDVTTSFQEAMDLRDMVDMLRLHNNKWFWAGINAVVSIVCAVVILWSPFTSTAVLLIFAGVSLIVEAVLDIVTLFLAYIGKKVADEVESIENNEIN